MANTTFDCRDLFLTKRYVRNRWQHVQLLEEVALEERCSCRHASAAYALRLSNSAHADLRPPSFPLLHASVFETLSGNNATVLASGRLPGQAEWRFVDPAVDSSITIEITASLGGYSIEKLKRDLK